MDGRVDGGKRETVRPAGLVARVLLSGVGLVVLLVLSYLAG